MEGIVKAYACTRIKVQKVILFGVHSLYKTATAFQQRDENVDYIDYDTKRTKDNDDDDDNAAAAASASAAAAVAAAAAADDDDDKDDDNDDDDDDDDAMNNTNKI
jgi:hypothetical protein